MELGLSADRWPVAASIAYDAFSWMGQLTQNALTGIHPGLWEAVISQGLV